MSLRKAHWAIFQAYIQKLGVHYSYYEGLAIIVDKAWRYAVSPENYKTGLVQRVRYIDNINKHTNHLEIAEVIYWWSYLCKHRENTAVTRGNFRTSRANTDATLSLKVTDEEKQEAVRNNLKRISVRNAKTKEKQRKKGIRKEQEELHYGSLKTPTDKHRGALL